jgi:Tol biopolymer transport system component
MRIPKTAMRGAAVAAVVLCLVAPQNASPAAPKASSTSRVSISSRGAQANGHSVQPAVSADGRFVAFVSRAQNLALGGRNVCRSGSALGPCWDVFVFDRGTRRVERVSVTSDGHQADGDSSAPSISGDGRYVAFKTGARNLTRGLPYPCESKLSEHTGGCTGIVIRDRRARTTKLISTKADGDAGDPVVAAGGRFVAYTSAARGVVVYDLARRTWSLESVAPRNNVTYLPGSHPSLSAEGRFLVFQSALYQLAPYGLPDYPTQTYLRDRARRTTIRISPRPNGRPNPDGAFEPVISADGRWIVYGTLLGNASNQSLVEYDRVRHTFTNVGVSSRGNAANNHVYAPSVSADGRYVVFESFASNLVDDDTSLLMTTHPCGPVEDYCGADVFRRDRIRRTTIRVTLSSNGAEGDEASGCECLSFGSASGYYTPSPRISADGSVIAFQSLAGNFDASDTNEVIDIFVRLQGDETDCASGVNERGPVSGPFRSEIEPETAVYFFRTTNTTWIAHKIGCDLLASNGY